MRNKQNACHSALMRTSKSKSKKQLQMTLFLLVLQECASFQALERQNYKMPSNRHCMYLISVIMYTEISIHFLFCISIAGHG